MGGGNIVKVCLKPAVTISCVGVGLRIEKNGNRCDDLKSVESFNPFNRGSDFFAIVEPGNITQTRRFCFTQEITSGKLGRLCQ